jgi:hypothetical protein
MRSVNLDEIADHLYGLPPDEFTAARDGAARDAEDADLRKAVKTLRKPTVSAAAVNHLVRRSDDDIKALLDLGDELRTAMGGDPHDVRRLTEQRRALISGLVDADLPSAVQQDVTATLEAATADPELGAAVRSGRLVKPLRYAGFGTRPDLADVMATAMPASATAGTTKKKASKQPAPTKATRKATKGASSAKRAPAAKPSAAADTERAKRLDEARQRVLDLAGAADDAQRRYETAVTAAVEARKVLDAAEAGRAEAHKAARAAHADAERARRDLGRLERS